jgi:flagellar hook protein FlgE
MSFQQGLSGLNAAAKNLDSIGNNVANSTTVGFKQSQVQFSDVYANSLSGSETNRVGIGVRVSQISQQFTQGNITATNNPMDIAINGGGFFRMDNNGSITYQRNGQFKIDSDGYIVSPSGGKLSGYTADPNGILLTGAATPLLLSTADLVPKITSEVNAVLNLDAASPVPSNPVFSVSNPLSYNNSMAVTVFDSLGNEHTMQSFFVRKDAVVGPPASPAGWDVYVQVDQEPANLEGTLVFTPGGAIDTAQTTPGVPIPVSLALPAGTLAAPTINLDLDFTGTTQFGAAFSVNALSQDGYTSGRLSGTNIAADGVILGRYTNGQTAVLGQIVLASFANPNGLQQLGDNQWVDTQTSGPPLVGVPNTANLGVLQSSAVEDSNVDLTVELVNMIVAQRVYQANAQTIQAQDQVLQTLINI